MMGEDRRPVLAMGEDERSYGGWTQTRARARALQARGVGVLEIVTNIGRRRSGTRNSKVTGSRLNLIRAN